MLKFKSFKIFEKVHISKTSKSDFARVIEAKIQELRQIHAHPDT